MKRSGFLASLAALAVVVSACGTRLPDGEFLRAAGNAYSSDPTGLGAGSADGGTASGGLGLPGTDSDGGTSSGSGASGSGGPVSTGGGGGGTGSAKNFASDRGVTATTITVGNITPVGGPLGPEAFSGPSHGARAYFQALNASGGVNGRTIKFLTCDDREDPEGNKACARNLIDKEKVFAFAANNTDAYAGAGLVNAAGVPDVGGIPIATAYYKYPMLFTIYGAGGYPRDGKNVGVKGTFYENNAPFLWYRKHLGIKKAAVLFYAIPASSNRAAIVIDMLTKSGIEVVYTPNGGAGKDPASPSWDTDVINMQSAGVEAFWQVIDTAGIMNVCQAMDRYGFQVKAAIASVANWTSRIGRDFSAPCRNSIYADANSVPYTMTSHPEIARFRAAMRRYDPNFPMQQWAVEGWAAARLLTEGIRSMGPNVTRQGLIRFLRDRRGRGFPDDVMTPDWTQWRADSVDFSKQRRNYFSVARWQDSAGGWVAQTNPFDGYETPWYPHPIEDDGT
ncbi:MAG: ABC transporter substrate-binding protein [Actinomycetota bacterium]